MANDEIFQRLLGNYQSVKAIRGDDGYEIFHVASIGRNSIELLEELELDDAEDIEFTKNIVTELKKIDDIEKRYYADSQYTEWVLKKRRHGNMDIFMSAVNCVEGNLEHFLHEAGLIKKRK